MRNSAGILMCRRSDNGTEFLLAHPGGPIWKNRDTGAWSLPKGEFEPGEDPLQAALREMQEETGIIAKGPFIPLDTVKTKSGKTIHAWACMGIAQPGPVKSNLFTLEWPPRSGKMQSFPEVDRVEWFTLDEAVARISPAQVPFLHRAAELVRDNTKHSR